VSLSLFSSSYDLSRRILIKNLYPFSFREYLYFYHNVKIDFISVTDILKGNWPKKALAYADRFDAFLKGENLPFSLEEPAPLPILKNIVSTVIRKDIPAISRLAVQELDVIEQMLEFIGKSEVDGINYSTLSNNLNITKYKAKQYVSLLEKAFILLRVKPAGTNVMKEPKILMALPYRLIYRDFKDVIGPLREDFFVETVLSLNKKIKYLKSTRGSKTPDYMISDNNGKIIIEVGGKGKGREQFKGIKEKKQLILSHSLETNGIKRPLFLAGFLGGD
jgi:predicted AAA+ superfamily ATPase